METDEGKENTSQKTNLSVVLAIVGEVKSCLNLGCMNKNKRIRPKLPFGSNTISKEKKMKSRFLAQKLDG